VQQKFSFSYEDFYKIARGNVPFLEGQGSAYNKWVWRVQGAHASYSDLIADCMLVMKSCLRESEDE